jgi:hypothetical protein
MRPQPRRSMPGAAPPAQRLQNLRLFEISGSVDPDDHAGAHAHAGRGRLADHGTPNSEQPGLLLAMMRVNRGGG